MSEWQKVGDQHPRYTPCGQCGITTIGTTAWLSRPPSVRNQLREQGILERRNGLCRVCHFREDRRRHAAGEPRATRPMPAAELLAEWRAFADPRLSVAENCRRLAPRLGMRWRSLERAIGRAKVAA